MNYVGRSRLFGSKVETDTKPKGLNVLFFLKQGVWHFPLHNTREIFRERSVIEAVRSTRCRKRTLECRSVIPEAKILPLSDSQSVGPLVQPGPCTLSQVRSSMQEYSSSGKHGKQRCVRVCTIEGMLEKTSRLVSRRNDLPKKEEEPIRAL